MKPHWITGFAGLIIVIGLAVAVLSLEGRHRAESRLTELVEKDRAIQRAIHRPRPAAPGPAAGSPKTEPSPTTPEGKPETKGPARPDVNAIFSAHPELQAAYEKATVGRLHQTYDRLWNRLGLSAAQIEQAVAVMMCDDENEMDLAMTAEALKLPHDDPALRQFRREEMTATQSALESALGPQGYQTLRDYNRALAVRSTAEDVASLTAVSSPMTGAQTEQLTQALADASASYRSGGQPNVTSTDWDVVLAKASTFLTPPQMAALQAKVQQVKAAAMLSQFYASKAKH